jgi:hypothetical protein
VAPNERQIAFGPQVFRHLDWSAPRCQLAGTGARSGRNRERRRPAWSIPVLANGAGQPCRRSPAVPPCVGAHCAVAVQLFAFRGQGGGVSECRSDFQLSMRGDGLRCVVLSRCLRILRRALNEDPRTRCIRGDLVSHASRLDHIHATRKRDVPVPDGSRRAVHGRCLAELSASASGRSEKIGCSTGFPDAWPETTHSGASGWENRFE